MYIFFLCNSLCNMMSNVYKYESSTVERTSFIIGLSTPSRAISNDHLVGTEFRYWHASDGHWHLGFVRHVHEPASLSHFGILLLFMWNSLHHFVDQVGSTLYVMQAASTKFGLYAGSIKFNTQSEEWMDTCNYMYNFTCICNLFLFG